MHKYICIHGHFYQPPRENPWTERIEKQESAKPYHDWNERITAECYLPNAQARILDSREQVKKVVNNYAKISFDFAPTLLSWMREHARKTYHAIVETDAQSCRTFSGHGSAMAQGYNHVIFPLADHLDKVCQAIWGIRDFEYRFGRRPEGLWLPETAVDLETLDILAQMGIAFTILSQRQAKRTRNLGARAWKNVGGDSPIDSTQAYALHLETGRKIDLFFYDDSIAKAVAFERLLTSGDLFANRLMAGFPSGSGAHLVNFATDGESYGHHHRFGEMALAYALDEIETKKLAQLTNCGEFLKNHPPTHEVQILENTSWSCAHGIERWRADCGCSTGANAGWNQAWRAPLRQSLDWLRDSIRPLFERAGQELFKHPWAAREAYISVILDRCASSVERFLRNQARARLLSDSSGKIRALKLMELQRHAQLMYTSCGWFFDDISGIETVQVLQYAARAIQLSQELFGASLEAEFLSRLEKSKSNIPEQDNGRAIYERAVKPLITPLLGPWPGYSSQR